MKKNLLFTLIIFITIIVSKVYAMDINISTIGDDDLKKTGEAIKQSIMARCISKNIDLSASTKLDITLSQSGNKIAYDAILNTTPPKAFHAEISKDNISATVDQMIQKFFTIIPVAQIPIVNLKVTPEIGDIHLPFESTSIAVDSDNIYISDLYHIYLLKDGKPELVFTSKPSDEIYRIFTYKGTIIASIEGQNEMDTFQIKDGQVVQRWAYPVTPYGDGLIGARLTIPPTEDMTETPNTWSIASKIEGNPIIPPQGTDLLGSIMGDFLPDSPGMELVYYGNTDNILVRSISGKFEGQNVDKKSFWDKVAGFFSPKNIIWQSPSPFQTLPNYCEVPYKKKVSTKDGGSETELERQRYYMLPRILFYAPGSIILIDNSMGLNKYLENVKAYKNTRLLSYTWNGSDFIEKGLMSTTMGYCADIALSGNNLLAVFTQKGTSTLRVIGLKS